MSKKIDLLDAASRVILSNGVKRLTLDAVAFEANVSKGGLLYHYPTKEALIKAMNIHVIAQFREIMEKEVASGYSYHQAYLFATIESLKDSDFLNINTSLLAAISNDKDILDIWKQEFKIITEKLSRENYKPEYSLLVRTACDGLWFSKVFNICELETDEEATLIKYLFDLLERGQL